MKPYREINLSFNLEKKMTTQQRMNFRVIAMSLSLTLLLATACLAIQSRETDDRDQQYDEGNFAPYEWNTTKVPTKQTQHSNQRSTDEKSSRRTQTRTRIDPALVKELYEQQRRLDTARSKNQSPLFGSPIFGPIVPYGSTNRATPSSRPVALPKNTVAPKTIRSPFANFNTLVATSPAANVIQLHAEENFHNGNYSLAAYQIDQAMAIDNENGHLKMFASLTNIAAGNYEKAGQLFHSATKILEAKDWDEIFSITNRLYGNSDFQKHVEGLNVYCNENPFAIGSRRLRGYLSLISGRLEPARADFEFVLSNDRNDTVTNKLLTILEQPNKALSSAAKTTTGFTVPKRIVNPTVNLKN